MCRKRSRDGAWIALARCPGHAPRSCSTRSSGGATSNGVDETGTSWSTPIQSSECIGPGSAPGKAAWVGIQLTTAGGRGSARWHCFRRRRHTIRPTAGTSSHASQSGRGRPGVGRAATGAGAAGSCVLPGRPRSPSVGVVWSRPQSSSRAASGGVGRDAPTFASGAGPTLARGAPYSDSCNGAGACEVVAVSRAAQSRRGVASLVGPMANPTRSCCASTAGVSPPTARADNADRWHAHMAIPTETASRVKRSGWSVLLIAGRCRIQSAWRKALPLLSPHTLVTACAAVNRNALSEGDREARRAFRPDSDNRRFLERTLITNPVDRAHHLARQVGAPPGALVTEGRIR